MSSTAVREAFTALEVAEPGRLDTAGCGDALVHVRRLRGWLDAVEAQVTSRMRALNEATTGVPPADEHARCGGVSAAEARRRERRSTTIDAAPGFGGALSDGSISAEHVDALGNATAGLDADVATAVFDLQDELLADAERLSPERFGRSVRDLARHLEHERGIERTTRQRRDTFLSRRTNVETGMVEGRYAFHPELAGQIFHGVDREIAAIVADGEAAGDTEFTERRFDRNRLAAEALGRLVANGHHHTRPAEADVTVVVDADTLTAGSPLPGGVCETGDGVPLPVESVRRLLCNGRVTPVVVDIDGVVLDAGRSIRHANRHQRRALRAMYRTCGFAGCDVAFDRCEMHHVVPWEQGGHTDLGQMLPLCSRHHHTVHERGWQLHLATDRTLTVTRPDGVVHGIVVPDHVEHRRRHHRRRVAA